MSVAEDIHRALQGIIIMKEFQTARDSENHLRAFGHVERMDCSWVFHHVVPWLRDPVIPMPVSTDLSWRRLTETVTHSL